MAIRPWPSLGYAAGLLFIYVGERDVECPPAQSLEFHHGLDAVGVPNSLVIYAGEA